MCYEVEIARKDYQKTLGLVYFACLVIPIDHVALKKHMKALFTLYQWMTCNPKVILRNLLMLFSAKFICI